MERTTFGSMVTLALWLTLVLHSPLSAAGDIRTLSIGKIPVVATNKGSNELLKVITKRNALDQERAEGASISREHNIPNSAEFQTFNDPESGNVSNKTLAVLENDRATHILQMRHRERRKQERLISIKAQILQNLRIKRKPNISSSVFSEDEQRKISAMVQKVHNINNNNNNHNENEGTHDNGHHQIARPSRHRPINSNNPDSMNNNSEPRLFRPQTTMQWLQSFYPSCVLQNHTDRGIWELPGTFRMHYDLPLKRYGSKVTILLAKLRLYKTTNIWNLSRNNLYENSMDGDFEISVSIYQLLRPLRANKRERKRLIHTQLLSMDKEGWVEFDVLPTLNFWLHHTHRNYGFDVQVEDSQGNKIDPNHIFRSMNCAFGDTGTHESPFPNIRGIHPEIVGENESSLFDNQTYPTLDLQIADVSTNFDSIAFGHFVRTSTTPVSWERNGAGQERVLTKRHLYGDCSNPNICRKESVYITIDELGLGDVIISPTGFEWIFCSGQPSTLFDGKSTEKSHPLSLMSRIYTVWSLVMKKQEHRKELYCLEGGWKSLAILYMDDEMKIQHKLLKKFLPTSCSCRIS